MASGRESFLGRVGRYRSALRRRTALEYVGGALLRRRLQSHRGTGAESSRAVLRGVDGDHDTNIATTTGKDQRNECGGKGRYE